MQAYDQNAKDYLPVSPGIGMHVEVKDPSEKVVISRVSLLDALAARMNFRLYTGMYTNTAWSCDITSTSYRGSEEGGW